MADAQGFSLLRFAVAGPTAPVNAYVCTSPLVPGIHFLSPVDLTYTPLVATCSLQTHADLLELTEAYAKAALLVLEYLAGL